MSSLHYSTSYYSSIQTDSAKSAAQVAPMIVQLFSPKTLVDVGCGSGTWTKALKDAGVKEVVGLDGSDVKTEQLLINPQEFQRHDLTQPLKLNRQFDLALSLEVAEHLPPERAKSFVSDLCQLSSVVIFSAAVPGQGGTHHVNEQWPSYWIAHFCENHFTALDCLRPQIWHNADVAWWYRQNMFAFIKDDKLKAYPAAVGLARQPFPADVAHPVAYATATVPEEMSPRMIKNVLQALPYFPGKVWKHLRKK